MASKEDLGGDRHMDIPGRRNSCAKNECHTRSIAYVILCDLSRGTASQGVKAQKDMPGLPHTGHLIKQGSSPIFLIISQM